MVFQYLDIPFLVQNSQLSFDFFKALYATENKSLYSSKAIQILIEYRNRSVARISYIFIVPQFAYFVLYMWWSLFLLHPSVEAPPPVNARWWTEWILIFVSAFLFIWNTRTIYQLYFTSVQDFLLFGSKGDFDETKKKFLNFFLEFVIPVLSQVSLIWLIFDLKVEYFEPEPHGYEMLEISEGWLPSEGEYRQKTRWWYWLSLQNVLMFEAIMQTMRHLNSVRFPVIIFFETFKELFIYMIILLIVLACAADSVFSLQMVPEEEIDISDFFSTIKAAWTLVFGDFGSGNEEITGKTWRSFGIFFLFSLIATLIYSNILITIVSDIFAIVSQSKDQFEYQDKCLTVVKADSFLEVLKYFYLQITKLPRSFYSFTYYLTWKQQHVTDTIKRKNHL